MKKIGIIGCGSMGGMLARRFLSTGIVRANQLMVSTREPQQNPYLKKPEREYASLETTNDNCLPASACQTIFLCIRPNQVKGVLEEIAGHLLAEAHLVSTAASVDIHHLEQYFKGKISRIVPGITLKVGKRRYFKPIFN